MRIQREVVCEIIRERRAVPGYTDIGAKLLKREGYLVVDGVLVGSPAHSVGLRKGDTVVGIEGSLYRRLILLDLFRVDARRNRAKLTIERTVSLPAPS